MMLDLAAHHDKGPTPLREIAKRQDLSVKYLEQLIIPLKAAGFIRSVRGARGGYTLGSARSRECSPTSASSPQAIFFVRFES